MEHNFGWYISQFGILLEAAGAIWIVFAAYKGMKDQDDSYINYAHGELHDRSSRENPASVVVDTFDAIADEFRQNSKKQFRNELYGFSALAIGLLLQFIGGF